MRILVVHNKYIQAGGEDVVVDAEISLLRKNDQDVLKLEFDNAVLMTRGSSLRNAFNSIFNIGAYLKTVRVINEFHPQVIHLHNLYYHASPSVLWAAWRCGAPVVMTLHNFRLICPSATLMHKGKIYVHSIKRIFPWRAVLDGVHRNSRSGTLLLAVGMLAHRIFGTWSRVERFLALTQFSRDMFFESSALGHLKDRIGVKSNFVDDHGYSYDKENFFLFVGRLSEEKGIDILISAFTQTSHKLIVVGDGPLMSDARARAKDLPNVEFYGAMPRNQVLQLMRRTKALIIPSLWYEGMPMVVLESFAAGTPVIASDHGSLLELVQHGHNGVLFSVGRSEALLEAICAISDPVEHRLMCVAARNTWYERFSPDRGYHALMQVYTNAIARRTILCEA